MKRVIFSFLVLLTVACSHPKSGVRKLTVVYYNNENPGYRQSIDTLMKAMEIDFSKTAVDLFFSHDNFHLPEFMPTGGINKNALQANECDINPDSLTNQCYKYDEADRVKQLAVRHKMWFHMYNYTYSEKNQISEINTIDHEVFTPVYNSDGSLRELTKKGGFLEKRLVFVYE